MELKTIENLTFNDLANLAIDHLRKIIDTSENKEELLIKLKRFYEEFPVK